MRMLVLVLSFSVASIASEHAAKEAFLADLKIKDRLSKLGAGYTLGNPKVILLKESCGFLGCVTDYMVGASLSHELSSQTSSILAKIVLTGETPSFVQILPEYKTGIMVE